MRRGSFLAFNCSVLVDPGALNAWGLEASTNSISMMSDFSWNLTLFFFRSCVVLG